MVMKVSEEDFSVTLLTRNNLKMPFKIEKRDIYAGTLLFTLEFEDPEDIS